MPSKLYGVIPIICEYTLRGGVDVVGGKSISFIFLYFDINDLGGFRHLKGHFFCYNKQNLGIKYINLQKLLLKHLLPPFRKKRIAVECYCYIYSKMEH